MWLNGVTSLPRSVLVGGLLCRVVDVLRILFMMQLSQDLTWRSMYALVILSLNFIFASLANKAVVAHDLCPISACKYWNWLQLLLDTK